MKKRNIFKILSLVLTLILSSTIFSGAATGKAGSRALSPISEELAKGNVNLVMYLVCDPQKDQDLVWAEVNKKLQHDIKTTVTIKNISWTDYLKKYQLLFASGEDFDCAFAGNFCNYSSLASKNAFMPLTTELIKTYAPKTWADMDQGFLKGSMVNGKIYMIPANQHDVRGSITAYRGDLAKKYNLKVTNLNQLYTYLEVVAKNEKIIPFTNDPDNTSWFNQTFGAQNAFTKFNVEGNDVKTFDDKPKVYSIFETKEFLQYALKMRELNQAGVFPKSLLSSKDQCSEMFPAGTVAITMDTYTGVYQEVQEAQKANPSWNPQIVDLTNYKYPLADISPSDAGLVINPHSKHVNRVLMMLDLLRENPSYQDLTYLGIEGKHWTASSATTFAETSIAQSSFMFNSNCPWAWGNTRIARIDASIPKVVLDIKKKWLAKKKDSVALAFQFNDSNVKSEETAINNVLAKYFNLLIYGFATDTKGTIAKMNAELKAVGLPKVQQETQKQLDAFAVQYNK